LQRIMTRLTDNNNTKPIITSINVLYNNQVKPAI
jgi:hypothetical protein